MKNETMIKLFILWFIISIVLTAIFSYIRLRKKAKCHHIFYITGLFEINNTITLCMECDYCGEHKDIVIKNKNIKIEVANND
jgi:hypothetical protein